MSLYQAQHESKDDFIDNCLDFVCGQFEEDTKVKSTSKKEYGRWSIYESQAYLEVIMTETEKKEIIRKLKLTLPNRIESQIRAHHQKMLRKFGSIDKIKSVLSRSQNNTLLRVNKKLELLLERFGKYSRQTNSEQSQLQSFTTKANVVF